jgi:hypothetical protein
MRPVHLVPAGTKLCQLQLGLSPHVRDEMKSPGTQLYDIMMPIASLIEASCVFIDVR